MTIVVDHRPLCPRLTNPLGTCSCAVTTARDKTWIGVDFDRTLSHRGTRPGESWDPTPGPPIQEMLERVLRWLAEGRDVRIVTARVASCYEDRAAQRELVERWCQHHLGVVLPVTAEKDGKMLELWDDSVVRVERNTGRRLSPSLLEEDSIHRGDAVACPECDRLYVHDRGCSRIPF